MWRRSGFSYRSTLHVPLRLLCCYTSTHHPWDHHPQPITAILETLGEGGDSSMPGPLDVAIVAVWCLFRSVRARSGRAWPSSFMQRIAVNFLEFLYISPEYINFLAIQQYHIFFSTSPAPRYLYVTKEVLRNISLRHVEQQSWGEKQQLSKE